MAFENARRRRAIRVLSAGRLVDALTNGLLITLIPYTLRPLAGWGGRDFQIGLTLSIGSLVSTLAQPWVGRRADRSGRVKSWVVGGMVLVGIGMVLFTLRDDTLSYAVCRLIQGLGVGVSIPTALVLVATLAGQERVGRSVGAYVTYRMVGFLIGPPIGAWFFVQGHPHWGFAAGALASLLAGGLVAAQVPNLRIVRNSPGHAADPVRARAPIPPVVLMLAFAQFIIGASVSVFAPLAVYFRQTMKIAPMTFSLAFSAFLLTRLACQYPAGRAADRFSPRTLINLGLAATAGALLLFPLARNGWMLIAGRALQGLTTSLITTPALAWVVHLAPESRMNEAMSYITMGFGLGLSLGPMVAGALVAWGSWGNAYHLLGLLTAGLSLGVYILRPHPSRPA